MSDEIDREITTKRTMPNTEYKVSEQHTTRVRDDNSSTGLVLGVLLTLALGVGAGVYFLNNRPAATIFVPGATNTIKENKSTVIERNNTTTKESPQAAPNVEVNIPPVVVPKVEINVPTPAATTPAPQPTPTGTPGTTN